MSRNLKKRSNKKNTESRNRLMFCTQPSKKDIQEYIKNKTKSVKEPFVSGYESDASTALTLEGFTQNDIERLTNIEQSDVDTLGKMQNRCQKQTDMMMQTAQVAEENIQSYNDAIESSEELLDQYSQDIKKKMNLVATRDRMLQLSQDRNVYKKKVVYMLLSILIAIFITIISFYTIYNK